MTAPVRVLHVVGQMNRAGTETWLMNVMRRIDRTRFSFDYLVHVAERGEFDTEIRRLGGAVIRCPHTRNPWQYWRQLSTILRNHGPYDVVHSHVHRFSAYPLLIASRASVAVRIAHSHSASGPARDRQSAVRRLYSGLSSRLIAAAATDRVACSSVAATALFGERTSVTVIPCGVDTEPFAVRTDRSVVRGELRIPDEALVMGHVGRFVEGKNHAFLVEILRRLSHLDRVHLLLVGDGPLRSQIEAQVFASGLGSRVTFAGSRADVAHVMSAMDLFLFPSMSEGLGLVLVEAQAAGLPCIASDAVPSAATVIDGLVAVLGLRSVDEWAEAALRQLTAPNPAAWPHSVAAVEGSPFSLDQSVRSLARLYRRDARFQRQAAESPAVLEKPATWLS